MTGTPDGRLCELKELTLVRIVERIVSSTRNYRRVPFNSIALLPFHRRCTGYLTQTRRIFVEILIYMHRLEFIRSRIQLRGWQVDDN